jgi:hypothetical protein
MRAPSIQIREQADRAGSAFGRLADSAPAESRFASKLQTGGSGSYWM